MMARRTNPSPRKPVLSAGIVPVHFGDEPLFLLLRAYRYWDFPKGVVEEGENPFDGAIRELREETGITQVDFRWDHEFFETGPYSYGKIARYYLGHVPGREVKIEANPTTGQREHDEFRWVTYSEARQLLVPRVLSVLDWAMGRIEQKSVAAGS
jgi:bis(5'-nucleosidyl)-tetraphosphatase